MSLAATISHTFLTPDDPDIHNRVRRLRQTNIGSDDYCQSFGNATSLFRHVAVLYMAVDKWIATVKQRQALYTEGSTWPDGAPRTTHLMLRQSARPEPTGLSGSWLPVDDVYYDKAKALIFRLAQANAFPQEYQALLHGHELPAKSRLRPLRPMMDPYQCLRLRGRMSRYSNLSYNERHPVLLPANAAVTHILVYDAHRLTGHKKTPTVKSVVNKTYYIPGFLNYYDQFLRNCVLCDLRASKPGTAPLGQVYNSRLGKHRCFEFVNVDMAGHFWIQSTPTQTGDAPGFLKTWCYIFTCEVSRFSVAFVVKDPGTREFLDAFSRLTAHHGAPSQITSDNQTCFFPASRALAEVTHDAGHDHPASCPDMQTVLKQLQPIRWSFNPPSASHRNTVECYVRSLKLALKKALPVIHTHHSSQPSHGISYLPTDLLGFQSLIDRIFTSINDRALQPVRGCDNLYVTPSRLALGRSLWTAPKSVHDAADFPEPDLAITAEQQRLVTDEFFEAYQAYLRDFLQVFRQWDTSPRKQVKKNDLVFVPPAQRDAQRHRWVPAFVTRVHKSQDGFARTVDVIVPHRKAPSGRPARSREATLPIQSVCPAETTWNDPRVRFRPKVAVVEFDNDEPASALSPQRLSSADAATVADLPPYDPTQPPLLEKWDFVHEPTPDHPPTPLDRKPRPLRTRAGRESRPPKRLDL